MRKLSLLLLTLFVSLSMAIAQQRIVTGEVLIAPENEPAVGASVLVKEHPTVGLGVGLDGKFRLTVPAGCGNRDY